MNTIIAVWIIVGSISSTSQNRSGVLIENIATRADCEATLDAIRALHPSTFQGRCIEVRKRNLK